MSAMPPFVLCPVSKTGPHLVSPDTQGNLGWDACILAEILQRLSDPQSSWWLPDVESRSVLSRLVEAAFRFENRTQKVF
jgi:hypothetical protein